jgi:ribosomal protein L32E
LDVGDTEKPTSLRFYQTASELWRRPRGVTNLLSRGFRTRHSVTNHKLDIQIRGDHFKFLALLPN